MPKSPLGSIRIRDHPGCTLLSPLPRISTMEAESQRPKERGGVVSVLDVAIEALNLAKEVSSVTPAKAVFGSVSVILTMIKVNFLLVVCCSIVG